MTITFCTACRERERELLRCCQANAARYLKMVGWDTGWGGWHSSRSSHSLELVPSDASVCVSANQQLSGHGSLRKEAETDETEALLPRALHVHSAASLLTPRQQESFLLRGPFVNSANGVGSSSSATGNFAAHACPPEASTGGRSFGRKSVTFADPAPDEDAPSTSTPGPHRWHRTTSVERGSGLQRKSSLVHHHHDSPKPLYPWQRIAGAMHALKSLGREVLSLYYVLHDPRTPRAARLLPWLIIMLARSPLSPIPDCIPILNVVSNLFLMPGLIWLAIHTVPQEVMQDARRRAAEGPVLLARSWPVPVLIFLAWLAVLEYCLYFVMHALVGGILTIGFVLWLLSLMDGKAGDWELLLMYGVDYKEMETLHWLGDTAPQVSHNRRAETMSEGGPITP